jgi:hypothetical protein
LNIASNNGNNHKVFQSKSVIMNAQLGSSRPKRASRRRAMTTAFVCLQAFLSCSSISGFELSMIASSSPFGNMDKQSLSSRRDPYNQRGQSPSSQSVTSSLVSQLAVVALKRRLKDQTHVACDVTANSSTMLLRGRVGPVTVKGRGWQSRMGLTCRAIEATVESCELDMGRVLSSQKLVLTVPGKLQQASQDGKRAFSKRSISFRIQLFHMNSTRKSDGGIKCC